MMNIIVLVKPVLDPESIQWNYLNQHFEYKAQRFNNSDMHSLQWACNYKENHRAHITALIVTDSKEEVDSKKILKWNIDECVIIQQENVDNNHYGVSSILVHELKKRKFDLILSGSESEDIHSGVIPVMTAEMLSIPMITHVHQIEPEQATAWCVHRKEGRGVIQTFSIQLPALIGVLPSISRKRYIPKFSTKDNSKKLVIQPSNIEMNHCDNIRVVKVSAPQPNIRYGQVASSSVAEDRLMTVMGFELGGIGKTPEKVTENVSDQHIHYVSQKLQKWLKEE